MGRQICFFATAKDYFAIFDYFVEKKWFFIDIHGEKIPINMVKNMVQSHYESKGVALKIFATNDNLNLVTWTANHMKFVDTMFSDVLEIIICSPPARNIRGLTILPNQYEHGRIWYERQYYDRNGNIVIKSQEVDKMYNALVRRIRKNAVISKDKFAYILPEAYRLYKEGCFRPCSGIVSIDFD